MIGIISDREILKVKDMCKHHNLDFDNLSKEEKSQVIAEVTSWDGETICLTT